MNFAISAMPTACRRRGGLPIKALFAAGVLSFFFSAALSAEEFSAEMKLFEMAIDEVERSMLRAAAASVGGVQQLDMEKRLGNLVSQARIIQQRVNKTALRSTVNVVAPVNRICSVFAKLRQGRDRPRHAVKLRHTSNYEFRRQKRREIAGIRKEEDLSDREKEEAVDRLYAGWLSTVKNNNLGRCSRISSDSLRSAYEEYILSCHDLRYIMREIRNYRKTPQDGKSRP